MENLNNTNLQSPIQKNKLSNFALDHKNQCSAETKLSKTHDLDESGELIKGQHKHMDDYYVDCKMESGEKLDNPNKRVTESGEEMTPDPISSYQKKGK
jgi:hypothetical protein